MLEIPDSGPRQLNLAGQPIASGHRQTVKTKTTSLIVRTRTKRKTTTGDVNEL